MAAALRFFAERHCLLGTKKQPTISVTVVAVPTLQKNWRPSHWLFCTSLTQINAIAMKSFCSIRKHFYLFFVSHSRVVTIFMWIIAFQTIMRRGKITPSHCPVLFQILSLVFACNSISVWCTLKTTYNSKKNFRYQNVHISYLLRILLTTAINFMWIKGYCCLLYSWAFHSVVPKFNGGGWIGAVGAAGQSENEMMKEINNNNNNR